MAPKGVERELTTVLGEGSSGRRDTKKCVVGLEITVPPPTPDPQLPQDWPLGRCASLQGA